MPASPHATADVVRSGDTSIAATASPLDESGALQEASGGTSGGQLTSADSDDTVSHPDLEEDSGDKPDSGNAAPVPVEVESGAAATASSGSFVPLPLPPAAGGQPPAEVPQGASAVVGESAGGKAGAGLQPLDGPVPLEYLLDGAGAGTRSREGAFGRILGAAVAESAHRCAGEWPARGRPDPVRQHCMLGGQLSLEVASLPATTGMRQPLTASCAAPVGWDNTANHGAGGAAKCDVMAAGYANGAVELLVNSAQGVQAVPLPAREKAPSAVTSLCFFAPHHGCPMWLLAAAYAGAEGRVRVFDVTDAVARLPASPSAAIKPAEAAAIVSGVAERTRAVGFEVVHLFRHFVRRSPQAGASPVAGCQLFVAAGEVPLGASPGTQQLRAIACRASPLKMLMSVTLYDHAVLHEPVSVYTGRFEPSGSCDVVDSRMAGAWRSVHSMPCLLRPPTPAEAPPAEPLAAFGSPTAASGRTQAAPDAASDHLQELLAVVAMDDVHICRMVNRDNKAHNTALRLSRLFSLGVGEGAWGGLGCAAWAPRAQDARHRFPLVPAASSAAAPRAEAPLLATAYLAASWNRSVHVFAVPPKVTASLATAEAKVFLQPQVISTFSLGADEVAASLMWLRTVTGRLKLAVAAIPAPGDGAAGMRGDGDIILPTLYLFDVRSGGREEVLELSAVMPESPETPLARALARMTPSAQAALEANASRTAADLNGGRTAADSVYRAVRGAVLRVADAATAAGFHALGDEKIVAALPDTTGPAPALVLHYASHLSWRAQADVLEAIAADAGAGGVGRWELCLKHACSHWLRLDVSPAVSPGAVTEASAIQQRIAAQLAAAADFLERAVAAAACAESRELLRSAAASGTPVVSWHPSDTREAASPGVRQLAAFVALVALLITCRPHPGRATAADAAQQVYTRLRLSGFRPECVLVARRLLRAGLQPLLPPHFIDDAVAVVLGAPAGPSEDAGGLAQRRHALEEIFLCMHDTAATDVNRLVAACRDNHLWHGLIHAADLVRQPLLPAHDMLAAAAVSAPTPGHGPDGGAWLLRYARACLLRAPLQAQWGGTEPQQDAYTAQMCMLAFLLWTTAAYFHDTAPPAVSQRLQDPYPVLQLLLRLDTQAVVAMFEELPLLADGAYCGTDDVAAAIAPLGLADLHRLAPHPVLTLRQAVVDAFAALMSRTGLDHGLQGPPPDSGAPAAALPVASGCGGSLAYSAMRFVCGQVARSPPAVVTPGFAAACMLRLSSEAPAAAGEGRQSLLATLITATTLDPRDEPTHDGACAILAPALRAMEEAELWGPAAMLHGRLGDFPGQIRCSLQHCQEVLVVCSDFEYSVEASGTREGLTEEQNALVARFHDLVQRPGVNDPRPGDSTPSVRAMADEAGQLLRSLLGRLSRGLQGDDRPGSHGDAGSARILETCAMQICRLEASYHRLIDAEQGRMHAADMVLTHLPRKQAAEALLDPQWRDRGLRAEQFLLLSYVVDTAASHTPAVPASPRVKACQVLALDAQIQEAFMSLCCELDLDRVVPSLQALHIADTPAVLRVLQLHNALDGQALLHLRAGQPHRAVTASLLHLRTLMRAFRLWLVGTVPPAASGGDPHTPQRQQMEEWTATLSRSLPLPAQVQAPTRHSRVAGSEGHRATRPPLQQHEGQGQARHVAAAVAATQRYIAAAGAAAATSPAADASQPHAGPDSWAQLLLALLAELTAAPLMLHAQPASQPHADGVAVVLPPSRRHGCVDVLKERWKAFVLHLLDSTIKACIESGAGSSLHAALEALASMHDPSNEELCDSSDARKAWRAAVPYGAGVPDATAASYSTALHNTAMVFGELCLRAQRTAFHLRNSQMQVMTSEVMQLQDECLSLVHQGTLTAATQ